MTAPTTIAESWDECLIEAVPSDATADYIATMRRAFFRGALAAATSGLTREQLIAELVAHGRSVGSQAEAAPLSVPAGVPGRALDLMRRRA